MPIDDLDRELLSPWPLQLLAGISPVINDPAPPDDVPLAGLPHSAFTDQNSDHTGATIAQVDPPMGDYEAITVYGLTPANPTPLLIERKVLADPNAPTLFLLAQTLFVEGVNIFY
ncbi:hypothetical protein [Pseudomonas fluorescens]|uniref:Uncharacterized protein n=1 Tax=Pseudomonas fluorescens TaxID=294 RepID=A0A423LN54_PSEFL|nr:hypothetical protein [Pseudomonas fluorescens]RON69770.1 hypothetical protein BK671_10210 [Pseudomonas fluorescens]